MFNDSHSSEHCTQLRTTHGMWIRARSCRQVKNTFSHYLPKVCIMADDWSSKLHIETAETGFLIWHVSILLAAASIKKDCNTSNVSHCIKFGTASDINGLHLCFEPVVRVDHHQFYPMWFVHAHLWPQVASVPCDFSSMSRTELSSTQWFRHKLD